MIELEKRTGTYALVFRCAEPGTVEIGRLGPLELRPGYYVYIGSAFGPGGIRARIGHHMNRSIRPHWHIDYLKTHCVLDEIWLEYSTVRSEARWVEQMSENRHASIPLMGFGASDGRAASHLFHFRSRPTVAVLRGHRPIRFIPHITV